MDDWRDVYTDVVISTAALTDPLWEQSSVVPVTVGMFVPQSLEGATIELVTTEVVEESREHMLGDLADACRYDNLVEQMKLVAIVGARKHGATWAQIAEVLGVTHQGARSTWLPRIKALEKEQASQ